MWPTSHFLKASHVHGSPFPWEPHILRREAWDRTCVGWHMANIPLNKYILLIGLLRKHNMLLDFQHDANKLCEEFNHVSILKACKG
jgi:hypothetical protein